MKVKTLSALAGVGAAMIMSSGAQAAPQLRVLSTNTTSTFLIANNLQSAVVGVLGTDFAPGEAMQGLIGTAANPWTITSSSGTFFNVNSDVSSSGAPFNGLGQTAATGATAPNMAGAGFDTGVLSNAGALFGGISGPGAPSNPIGFAQFGVGANSPPGSPVSWLSLNPAGVPVPAGGIQLFRLTWSRLASATLSMVIVTNTGGGNGFEYASSLTIPAVPAPGALALLGVAGLVGGARRRRA
jgi:hypothetical protein